jgi:hypothetical protein
MTALRLFTSLLALVPVVALHAADAPLYKNDFEAAPLDKEPEGMLITAGDFRVKQEGSGKVLELPGDPLDTFGLLFGPSQKAGVTASARFFGTKTGRKYPTFGVSLGGVGGYRLQVSPAKKTLEIFQGDEGRHSVPFDWTDGSWTSLRIQTRKDGDGWVVEGKAWPAGTPEPAAWTISFPVKEEPPAGRAGIWGSPYSGTLIRFDDLLLVPAH